MRLLSTTALAGIIALAMAGCGSGEESNVAVQPSPSVPQPSQQPDPKAEAKPSQTQTIVAQKPIETKPSAAAGLIQPTNPNQRTQQVQKGRSDPFAGLFTIAPPKVVVKPQVVPPPPKPPAAPPPPPQPVAIQPAPRPIAPPPPPPPQTDLARGIAVFGVVQVGDKYQAIVQVPNEATSRYISEGQRLSDGQILVKSIELNPGSEPVVVLEQNGIEVTRAVGEEPAKTADNQTGSTTSSSMNSSLPVTNSSVAEINNIRLQDDSPNAIPVPPPPASKRSPADSVPPPPPAVEPSSEAELQSHSRLEQPPSVTSALPATPLFSNPLSGVVDNERLDANYPPAAIRDVKSVQKRQNLQRYRQLVNRLKMGR